MLLDLDHCWTDERVEGSTSLRRFKDSVHDYCECLRRASDRRVGADRPLFFVVPFGPTICAIIDTYVW